MKGLDKDFTEVYPSEDELEVMIKREAKRLNIAPHPMDEVKKKVKDHFIDKIKNYTILNGG